MKEARDSLNPHGLNGKEFAAWMSALDALEALKGETHRPNEGVSSSVSVPSSPILSSIQSREAAQ